MEAFKWVWSYIKEYKIRVLAGFLLVLVVSALNMVNPYISGIIVDRVIIGKQTDILIRILAIMVGVTLVKSIIRYTYQLIFERISQNVIFNMRQSFYSKLQELDFGFFDKTRTGDIMARMTGDMDAVRHFISWVVYTIFENLMIFIFAIVMLFSINSTFALIVLAVTPLIGFFTLRLAGAVKPAFSAIRLQFSKLNTVVQENITGNRVVKAFAKEKYETEKLSRENEGFKEKNMAATKIWEKYLPVLDSLAGILTIIIILVGGVMVIKHTLTLGELVTFNSYIWALNMPMRMAGWLVNDVQRFAASADKIIEFSKTETRIKNSENSIKKNRIKGKVEFRNVSFSYEEEEILKNVSFEAKPGQTIGFIGPTGSGKSTLMSLICRFYDCNNGEILIDDMDIKDMDIRKLRENISVAMQDIFLFSDTIEGNIAYGAPDAKIDQIQHVADIAGADEFIVNFPEGYDTIIGERGVGLSGGQKQRIALARALMKNPSVLILDDTTSSVDIEMEHKIHKTLKSYFIDKTVFVIAHRISSIKNADMIYVLNNGEIAEQGQHEELMAKEGYYYSVFKNQYGDFDKAFAREVV